MEQPTQTPDEVIKEMKDIYGAAKVAAVIAATLDWMAPNEYEQDFNKLSKLLELLRHVIVMCTQQIFKFEVVPSTSMASRFFEQWF